MLVLTRDSGTKIYCGYRLEKDRLEETNDFFFEITKIVSGLKKREVHLLIDDCKEKISTVLSPSQDKVEFNNVTLSLQDIISLEEKGKDKEFGRTIPQAKLGVDAPKEIVVYRDDIN